MGRIIKNHKTATGAAMLLACTFLALAAWAAPRAERVGTGQLWLSHFVGDQVVVTFTTPPPNMRQTVKAQLMDAEVPGIVLKLGRDEIFFPFANIAAVEPARK
jgi:hypothetical protein